MLNSSTDYAVLIVDDETPWLKSVGILLERSLGLSNIIKCQDSRNAMSLIEEKRPSVVLLDVTMPYLSGTELLATIKETYPEIPVIMLSGRNEVDIAVGCIKIGAFDYFVKTVDEDRLLNGVRHALTVCALSAENDNLKQRLFSNDLQSPEVFAKLVTCSPLMKGIFRYLEAISKSKEPVLVTGETGVGKELVAKAIHRLSCQDGPWVAVNVAGLSDQMFADTLFGHVKGAFTNAQEARAGMVEKARMGVLFLDEIGDLSLESQVKLLRLLQENEYFPIGSDTPRKAHTRFVFATNHDLPTRINAGLFRRDLYYRLQTHQVKIPALRERREDVALLLDHYLAEAAAVLGKRKPTPPGQLVGLLQNYPFPGNIREFRAMVYDAVSRHHQGVLSMTSFQAVIDAACLHTTPGDDQTSGTSARDVVFPGVLPTLKEMAALLVDEAMARTHGNQTQAARLLGVTRAALGKRLKSKS